MDRRLFLKRSCTACVAIGSGFLAGAVLNACKTPMGVIKTSSAQNKVRIPLTEFAATDYKLVRVSNYDYDLAVQKNPDGSFLTLVMVCSHAGQPLTKTGNTYYCTLHGSQFSHEGKVMKGPAEKDIKRLPSTTDNEFLTIHLS